MMASVLPDYLELWHQLFWHWWHNQYASSCQCHFFKYFHFLHQQHHSQYSNSCYYDHTFHPGIDSHQWGSCLCYCCRFGDNCHSCFQNIVYHTYCHCICCDFLWHRCCDIICPYRLLGPHRILHWIVVHWRQYLLWGCSCKNDGCLNWGMLAVMMIGTCPEFEWVTHFQQQKRVKNLSS